MADPNLIYRDYLRAHTTQSATYVDRPWSEKDPAETGAALAAGLCDAQSSTMRGMSDLLRIIRELLLGSDEDLQLYRAYLAGRLGSMGAQPKLNLFAAQALGCWHHRLQRPNLPACGDVAEEVRRMLAPEEPSHA